MSDLDLALQTAIEKCASEVKPYPDDGRLYCNQTWDGWGCWDYTLAGDRAYEQCPSYIDGFDVRLKAFKDCTEDGTWWLHPHTNNPWTNYTTCINTQELEMHQKLIHLFVAGYSISIITMAISLIIFFYFRQLRCDRVTLHKNLFLSYIVNGFVWILYYTLAAMDGEVLKSNPIWCQVLHVVTQYCVTSNFFWMFCEGLYLHTIIVVAFTSGKKLRISCYIVGWCFPLITTLVYSIVRGTRPEKPQKCWLDESDFQWIVLGPIVATLLLSLIFLCNIVRVLVTKLRAVNSPDTNQTRKAVRATLILIPLLGLQYILLPMKPDKGSKLEEPYLFISAFVTSFQGFFVALIFCFFNGEVIAILKRKWGQHRLMHGKTFMDQEFGERTGVSEIRRPIHAVQYQDTRHTEIGTS